MLSKLDRRSLRSIADTMTLDDPGPGALARAILALDDALDAQTVALSRLADRVDVALDLARRCSETSS